MDFTDLSALMGEDLAAETYADIWVVLPDLNAAPLLGEARRLADGLGSYVHAVIGDDSLSEKVISLGADRVHVAPVLYLFLQTQRPEFAFFPASRNGHAARAAQHFKAGLITDARNLSIDEGTRALLGSHPVYGGDYFLDFALTSPVKFATLDPRLLPEPYADPGRSGEVVPSEFPSSGPPPIRNLGPVDYTPRQWRPLTRARVIVSVGRGVKDAEGVALAQQLAERLGAEFAGDQSARDSGWVDETHQVGVTAQEVAPDLYIAVGILGDTYHNAAIAGARCVVAIHPNPDAPIFKVADHAVAAHPKELLPKLLQQLA